LFLAFMVAPTPQWGTFLAVLTLGSLALAVTSTIVGAVIAQTRSRGALFAAVSMPLVLLVLAAAVSGTRAQWAGGSAADCVCSRRMSWRAGRERPALRPSLGGLR
jgi:ABC-type transport system involved in cytochrome c biogenesis permease component